MQPAPSQIVATTQSAPAQGQNLQNVQKPMTTTTVANAVLTTPQKPPITSNSMVINTTQNQVNQPPQQQQQTTTPSLVSPNSVTAQHAHQQLIQESEQFASAWLRATVEPASNLASTIEQQELYRLYMQASTKVGRRGVLSPIHFPRIVRTVFGGTVGPNNKSDGQMHYEGLKLRLNPLPMVQKTVTAVSVF